MFSIKLYSDFHVEKRLGNMKILVSGKKENISLHWTVSMVEGGQEKNVTWCAFEFYQRK